MLTYCDGCRDTWQRLIFAASPGKGYLAECLGILGDDFRAIVFKPGNAECEARHSLRDRQRPAALAHIALAEGDHGGLPLVEDIGHMEHGVKMERRVPSRPAIFEA